MMIKANPCFYKLCKTFVGIIYNSIVERLISGEIEVTI